MATTKNLVIIDGNSIFYRGYYAMPNLSTNSGMPTGGVYGFAVLALEIIKKFQPDYVCVAWDKPGTNIRKRKEIYADYKAGRKKPPDDFYVQIPVLHELLQAFSWPMYELDDYEADDIMASLAHQADQQGLHTILVSSDLDLLQALSDHTDMYALKKGLSNIQKFNAAEFEKKYNIKVEQFIDFKAIAGDSSDNIPGVAGIGKKGAADLLNQFGTLEGIYQNLDNIKETPRKKLEASREMAMLSKKLVTLMLDVPIKLDLPAMDVNDLDVVRLRKDLQDLEFHSLLRQLPKHMLADAEEISMPQTDLHLPLPKVKIHTDLQALAELDWSQPVFLQALCKGRFGAEPQVVLASDDAKLLHVFKLGEQPKLQLPSSIKELRIYGYDTKRMLQMLLRLGVKTNMSVEHDAHVGAFLLNPLTREQDLGSVARQQIGYDSDLNNLDAENFIAKAPEIAAIIFALRAKQVGELKKLPKLHKLAKEIEWAVIATLARVELAGMKLDANYLGKMHDKLAERISDLEQTIYGYADAEFNISSPTQLAEILYDKLGLPTAGVKKGKTGYSTAANELAKLRGQHPIIEHISEYRELTKLQSTYVDTLPDHQDADQRIRSDLRLTVAATGRLSSSDPNLQNIPVRTEVGKQIRRAFIADDGNVLVSADYSQFELRLAAVMAEDHDMIEAFNSDQDIHTLTASQVYGVALEDVTKEMRYSAKAVNFGLLYGQGSHGLAQQTGMSYADAKAFIDKYFEKRTALRDYLKSLRELAKDQGYVETIFGRRRPTPDVKSSNFAVREAAYRQAVNMPIQGTEADLMKLAMIRLEEAFAKEFKDSASRPRQIMQVHDSIVVECPAADAQQVAQLMQKTMENIYPELGIRLKVDTTNGLNWGEL